jgi:tRNA U38,U39,U40 pseudouridine synthase TruA
VQFFTNSSSINPAALPYKLNSLLPHDIRVFWMRQTAPDFNVTVSALRKVRYLQDNLSRCDPSTCLLGLTNSHPLLAFWQ